MCDLKKTKAVIFDLDGTLWDAAETIAPAWNAYCRSRGIARRFTPDDCRSYCGKTLPEIAAVVFPEAEAAWREAVITGCCDAECVPLAQHGGRLYPQAGSVLAALHRSCFLAVVSNCGLGYIEAFFSGNRTGRFFDDYENAARTGLSKGENIRLVMARNGIREAVYVGDTAGDQRAARQAGIPFIHAAYGYGRVSGADAVLHELRELPGILRDFLPDPPGFAFGKLDKP